MAKTLNELVFLNNNLTGCLPEEIGLLTNLNVFDISWNNFIGTLPKGLSGLKQVNTIDIGHNKLAGQVLDSICELPSLENFTYSFNFFEEEMNSCQAPKHGLALDSIQNCLPDGPNQKSVEECLPVVSKPVDCEAVGCRGNPGHESPVDKPPPSTPESSKSQTPPSPKVTPLPPAQPNLSLHQYYLELYGILSSCTT